MTSVKAMLAKKFPGLIYPDKMSVRPGELVGFLEKLLQSDPECRDIALQQLPKKEQ